ncbi:Oidioi.mRNA.OKI2018_I69.PAR.g11157.t1.cds [Oikopleura dioica]|uniref:Oidioi.mRNA.OKI2018_I69.PAR.g11157.t1.cds n=1 Tax=Oikopleura dioica TaxID=34765 RepID=A0ABN7RUB1_OIKDI|nr:Oidioi.mRNA.OKI2018_I69.PAR.g11157.t1.cds [Oikopleura dioica]
MFRATISMTTLALGFSVILMVQVIHQFCAAKNKQIQEYSDNQNAPQTTAVDQPSDIVPPPAYPQQQTVTIQAPPNQSLPQGTPQAPTYIQLPNGQVQLIQPGQAQTVYVTAPKPPPIYKTSEEHLATFQWPKLS